MRLKEKCRNGKRKVKYYDFRIYERKNTTFEVTKKFISNFYETHLQIEKIIVLRLMAHG